MTVKLKISPERNILRRISSDWMNAILLLRVETTIRNMLFCTSGLVLLWLAQLPPYPAFKGQRVPLSIRQFYPLTLPDGFVALHPPLLEYQLLVWDESRSLVDTALDGSEKRRASLFSLFESLCRALQSIGTFRNRFFTLFTNTMAQITNFDSRPKETAHVVEEQKTFKPFTVIPTFDYQANRIGRG